MKKADSAGVWVTSRQRLSVYEKRKNKNKSKCFTHSIMFINSQATCCGAVQLFYDMTLFHFLARAVSRDRLLSLSQTFLFPLRVTLRNVVGTFAVVVTQSVAPPKKEGCERLNWNFMWAKLRGN